MPPRSHRPRRSQALLRAPESAALLRQGLAEGLVGGVGPAAERLDLGQLDQQLGIPRLDLQGLGQEPGRLGHRGDPARVPRGQRQVAHRLLVLPGQPQVAGDLGRAQAPAAGPLPGRPAGRAGRSAAAGPARRAGAPGPGRGSPGRPRPAAGRAGSRSGRRWSAAAPTPGPRPRPGPALRRGRAATSPRSRSRPAAAAKSVNRRARPGSPPTARRTASASPLARSAWSAFRGAGAARAVSTSSSGLPAASATIWRTAASGSSAVLATRARAAPSRQRLQPDLGRQRAPGAQRGQHRVQVLAGRQPAPGEHEQHRQPAEPAADVGDQLQAGRVGQVQVLQGQQHAAAARPSPGTARRPRPAGRAPAADRPPPRARPAGRTARGSRGPGRSGPGRRPRAGPAAVRPAGQVAERVGPDGERGGRAGPAAAVAVTASGPGSACRAAACTCSARRVLPIPPSPVSTTTAPARRWPPARRGSARPGRGPGR